MFLEEFRIGAGRAERSEGDAETPCTEASLFPGTSAAWNRMPAWQVVKTFEFWDLTHVE